MARSVDSAIIMGVTAEIGIAEQHNATQAALAEAVAARLFDRRAYSKRRAPFS